MSLIRIIRSLTIHAPRGTFESLQRYNPVSDIVGTDIYPVAYPPGLHSGTTNRELSMVGDYTKLMVKLADGKKGVWMTLQIAWSGVLNPGKTLRSPRFTNNVSWFTTPSSMARGV